MKRENILHAQVSVGLCLFSAVMVSLIDTPEIFKQNSQVRNALKSSGEKMQEKTREYQKWCAAALYPHAGFGVLWY